MLKRSRKTLLFTLALLVLLALGVFFTRDYFVFKTADPVLSTYDSRVLNTYTGQPMLLTADGRVLRFASGTVLLQPRSGDVWAQLDKADESLSLVESVTGQSRKIAQHVNYARWTADGKRLFYFKKTADQKGYARGSFYLYDLNSEASYLAASYIPLESFQFSPDGSHLAYLDGNITAGQQQLVLRRIEGREAHKFLVGASAIPISVDNAGKACLLAEPVGNNGLTLWLANAGGVTKLTTVNTDTAAPQLQLFANRDASEVLVQWGEYSWSFISATGKLTELSKQSMLWSVDNSLVGASFSQPLGQAYAISWYLVENHVFPCVGIEQSTKGLAAPGGNTTPADVKSEAGRVWYSNGSAPAEAVLQGGAVKATLLSPKELLLLAGQKLTLLTTKDTPATAKPEWTTHDLSPNTKIRAAYANPASERLYYLTASGELYTLTRKEAGSVSPEQPAKPTLIAKGLTQPEIEKHIHPVLGQDKLYYLTAGQDLMAWTAGGGPKLLARKVVDYIPVDAKKERLVLLKNQRQETRSLIDLYWYEEGKETKSIDGAFYPFSYFFYVWVR